MGCGVEVTVVLGVNVYDAGDLPSSTCPDPDTAVLEADECDESGSDADDDLEREVDQIMNDIFREYQRQRVIVTVAYRWMIPNVTSTYICPDLYSNIFLNLTIKQLTSFSAAIPGFDTYIRI